MTDNKENCIVPYRLTTGEYQKLAAAYDWFNQRLFAGKLPDVVITMNHSKPRCKGYFKEAAFAWRDKEKQIQSDGIGEISLNPEGMFDREDIDVMSTLAHEMAHVWQCYLGNIPRKGYHNRQWGTKMKEIGLMPSNTGLPDGKQTGQQMTHYIMEGGRFESECKALFATGWKLELHSSPSLKLPPKKSKVKFICKDCDQAAWAKPSASLRCGRCSAATLMVSEDQLD